MKRRRVSGTYPRRHSARTPAPVVAMEERTYVYDSCPNCGKRSYMKRVRVFKCASCFRFYCSDCRTPVTHSCPHCKARRSGNYIGRA